MKLFCKYEELLNTRLVEGDACDLFYELYESVINNWEDVLNKVLDTGEQALYSYLLMIYSEYDKLNELYEKYQSLEVAGNLIRLEMNQGRKQVVEKLLEKHLKTMYPTQSLIDLLGWALVYYSQKQRTGEIEKYYPELEKQFEKLKENASDKEYKYFVAFKLFVEGNIAVNGRDLVKSIELTKKAIEIIETEQIYDPYLLGTLYNLLGINYVYSGHKDVKKMFYKAIDYFAKEKIERGIAVANGNLAYVLIKEGRYEKAMELLYEFDETMRKYHEIRNLILNYSDIYYCLKSLGRMEEAEKNLNIALELMKEYNEPNEDIFIDAAEFYALRGEVSKAEEFLQKYYDYLEVSTTTDTVKRAIWQVHKGFIELKKKNMSLAEEYLREGIGLARKNGVIPIILQGLMYLIELLITKYKIEDSEKQGAIIEEIELLGQECIAILKNHNNIFQMVNYQMLLATAYMLSNNMSNAIELLERAEKICIQYELDHQLKRVKKMLEKAKTIKNTVASQYELTTLLHEYSTKSLQELTYLSEPIGKETPIAILVILSSGLPCFSYKFEKTKLTDDDLLISGLINAIQKFSSQISWKKGTFRLMAHSDYILLLDSHETYTIAVFAESFTNELKDKLVKFGEQVEQALSELNIKKVQYLEGEQTTKLEAKLIPVVKQLFG
ncbi:MAG: tetratricopeptide repeat protein [Candidatus Heimdallarchaeaceae archaeon]